MDADTAGRASWKSLLYQRRVPGVTVCVGALFWKSCIGGVKKLNYCSCGTIYDEYDILITKVSFMHVNRIRLPMSKQDSWLDTLPKP
jgi:hypothetical protein